MLSYKIPNLKTTEVFNIFVQPKLFWTIAPGATPWAPAAQIILTYKLAIEDVMDEALSTKMINTVNVCFSYNF